MVQNTITIPPNTIDKMFRLRENNAQLEVANETAQLRENNASHR